MALKLYDLAGAEDDRRFSPPCWRVKMALQHKGLEAEEIPWRFTEKEVIAFSGQKLVPVLVDGEKTITDSWAIAQHLEQTYPDRPSLFGGAVGEAEALFIKFWCEQAIQPIILKIILPDLFKYIHEKDKAYFRESREKRLGMSLDAYSSSTEESIEALQHALSPLRLTLKRQPFLGGTASHFSDYIVFGAFQWARAMSSIQLLLPDDPVYAWRDRLLHMFNNYALNTSLFFD